MLCYYYMHYVITVYSVYGIINVMMIIEDTKLAERVSLTNALLWQHKQRFHSKLSPIKTSLKKIWMYKPFGPRILTVSCPGPAPWVLTVNEPSYCCRTPLCIPGPDTRTLLGSGGPFTFTVNGLPAVTTITEALFLYTVSPKNKTCAIWNILYSCTTICCKRAGTPSAKAHLSWQPYQKLSLLK